MYHSKSARIAHKKKLMQDKYWTFEPFVNANWLEIVQHRVYRFKWQRTLAHWHLVKVEWTRVVMESKHWSVVRWNLNDLI